MAGGLAGVVVGGLGSRIAMRIAALTARDVAQGLTTEAGATIGRITFEGTAFLVVAVGIGTALVGTAFYLATLPWLPRRRTLRALAFGGLELVVFGTVLLDPGNPDFTILGRPLLNVLVLGSLFVLHGVALVLLVEPSRTSRVGGRARTRAGAPRLVDVGTFLAMGLTALGAFAAGRPCHRVGDGRDDRPVRVRGRPRRPRSPSNATDHAAGAPDRGCDRAVASSRSRGRSGSSTR